MKKLKAVFLLLLPCVLYSKQEFSIKNIKLANTTFSDASCLQIKYDLLLKQSYNESIKLGDSTDTYIIQVLIKDTTKYVQATKGFKAYADTLGRVTTALPMLLLYDAKLYGEQILDIPLSAIALSTGDHLIKVEFRIMDKQGKVLLRKAESTAQNIKVLPKINLHLSIREIDVSHTDEKGEAWDYYLVHPEGAMPDIFWAVNYAAKRIAASPTTINSYVYTDEEDIHGTDITITEGDIFYVNVYDFDVTSFSDKIGTMRIDINDFKNVPNNIISSKFDLVTKMDFSIVTM